MTNRKRPAIAAVLALMALAGCTAQDPFSSSSPPPSAGSSPGAASPSPSVSATPTPTPTPTPPEKKVVTVVLNGDLLWHNTLWFGAREDAASAGQKGFDFAPLLAGLKPVISSADMAVCHEEVPLAPKGGPYFNYPVFAAPPQVVDAIKSTGYDYCTTASNHSVDQGFAGLKRTLDAFDKAKIKHAGTARTERESQTPQIFSTSEGVKVAVVAATFGLNGLPKPTGKEWSVGELAAKPMLAQAKRARAAGADIVLAAMHAGDEYSSDENQQQKGLATALTASPDVDLVYGHHVHVVQPWTKINNKWVIYGLGNFVAQHEPQVERGYEGVTARITFTQGDEDRYQVTEAEYIPTLVTRYQPGRPARVYQVSKALKESKPPVSKARLRLAEERTSAVVRARKVKDLTQG